MLRVIGGRDVSGYQLASYLTFEAGYTRALIELGYRDAMEARSALVAFMSGERLPPVMTAAGVAKQPSGRRLVWRAVTVGNSAELRHQLVDDVDRAVLAAGAADSDGQIAAIAREVLGNPGTDELRDVRDQRRDIGLRFEEADDLGVTAGEVAQRRLPVGIGQRAGIEHEIGVARNAVLEAEGLERQ